MHISPSAGTSPHSENQNSHLIYDLLVPKYVNQYNVFLENNGLTKDSLTITELITLKIDDLKVSFVKRLINEFQ